MLELLTDLMKIAADGRCAYAEARHVDSRDEAHRASLNGAHRRDRQLGLARASACACGSAAAGASPPRATSRAPAREAALARALAVAEAQPAAPATAARAGRPPPAGTGPRPASVDPFAVALEDKLELLFAAEAALRTGDARLVRTVARAPRLARAQGLRLDRGRGLHPGERELRRRHRRPTPPTAATCRCAPTPLPTAAASRAAGLGARARASTSPAHAPRVAEEAVALLSAPPCPRARARSCCTASRWRCRSTSRSATRSSSTASCSARPPTRARAGSDPATSATLRYGSELVHVTADATLPGGLGSFGWDDEGVAAVRADLVEGGVLRAALSNRESAAAVGLGASGGCARADGFARQPIVRMTNVSLEPGDGAARSPISSPTPATGLYLETQPLVVDRRPPPAVPVRHRGRAARSAAASSGGCTATAPTPA